jgi:tripeptidyl-peptidase-1
MQFCVACSLLSVVRAAAPGEGFLQKSHERTKHEQKYSVPAMTPAPPPPHWAPLVISLKQRNVDTVFEAALNVSTPGHNDYGQYWSMPDIEKLTAPAAEHVQVVTDWLESINATYFVDYELVAVTSNAELAEKNMPSAVRAVTAAMYSLKSDPVGHVAQPLPRKSVAPAALPANAITPALISEIYSTGSATVNRSGLTSQIAFTQGSFTSTKSLQRFLKEVPQSPLHQADDADFFSWTTVGGSRAPPQSFNCNGDDPTKYPSQWCIGYPGEPTLDVEWMVGTAPGIKTSLFRLDVPVSESLEGYFTPACPTLLAFVNYLLKGADAPTAASISYGMPDYCPDLQMKDLEIFFAKLALKGVSLMAASGDHGTQNTTCTTSACTLRTVWPAASPWVTAVGGTHLVKDTAGVRQEAWNGSGGGFSEYSSRKFTPWQERAVSAYLTKLPSLPGAPPNSTFHAAGVGVPDVASFAVDMATCVVSDARDSCEGGGDGTSFASPTFAGIVSLLNEARLEAKLPPMGFLNPFLYKNADAFTDITEGSNKDLGDLYGFPATQGWDAATGLGTPIFEKLRAAALRSFP